MRLVEPPDGVALAPSVMWTLDETRTLTVGAISVWRQSLGDVARELAHDAFLLQCRTVPEGIATRRERDVLHDVVGVPVLSDRGCRERGRETGSARGDAE